ncbi:MAG: hypothetical protein SVX43_07355, partial [Cyanobacteriota bacterium]|nr:hypothetical protein [Cyanobacteriota bacterium]
IKTRKKIGLTLAREIVKKETISAILTTGGITDKAKKLFDEYDIAYAENVPDREFIETEAQEE